MMNLRNCLPLLLGGLMTCGCSFTPSGNLNSNGVPIGNLNTNSGTNQNDNCAGNDNASNDNASNENENDNSAELTTLTAVNFQPSDVTTSVDPVTLIRGDGSITFEGGVAAFLGIVGLYYDDSFAWVVSAPGTATITFNDLDVREISLYFAQSGFISATMTVYSTDDEIIDQFDSVEAFVKGEPEAIFEIDGGGKSIDRLEIEAPGLATVSVDQLILTVAP